MGGKGTAFDCSEFTQAVYKKALGKNIPRTSIQQFRESTKVDPRLMQEGDLLFWDTGVKSLHTKDRFVGGGYVTHVGIYLPENGGSMLHFGTQGKTIVPIGGFMERHKFLGARRFVSGK